MKGSTLGLIVICVLVLLISGVFAFKYGSPDREGVFTAPGGSSSRASSLSNVKQFNLALIMYAADYDDKFPVQMSAINELRDVVLPYCRNGSIFSTHNPNGGLVEANENLAAAPNSTVRNGAGTVLLFEANEWPDGDRIIGYMDGHAKFISGFDRAVDTEIDISAVGQQMLDQTALEIEAAKTRSAAPPTNSLGMPGG